MLHLTAGRVGSLLARRATAALTNSSVRMASHGHDVAEMVDMSQPLYVDRVDIPLPDRPYKDTLSPAEESLKQKEKGPWSQLSKEEKLALYRLKFCQTFPEMQEPSAEWKTVLGGIFIFLGLTGLVVWWQKVYVYPARPRTFDDDWQAKQGKTTVTDKIDGFTYNISKFSYFIYIYIYIYI
uniref:Cytochrome c oxidase subunit 4 n=1 Tax=Scophthalmus maximus TaxID=52904 RepID=A0A8D3DRL6_SCOMX